MKNQNIVQKIWALCHILRGDGISYHQYVSELTYLLFLKIAEETGAESLLPPGFRWKDLVSFPDDGLLAFYQEMLTHLGNHADSEIVRDIYMFPTTVFSHGENLRAVIDGIAKLDWHDVSRDGFGIIYEGLLQHSADVRSGAGQYFTPRALINAIVDVTKPALGELIQDPAAGSGGFLVAADRFVKSENSDRAYREAPPHYEGAEIEKNTRRICLMNIFLNGLNARIIFGDALTDDGADLGKANLILANPPFGVKSGSRRKVRSDISYPNSNRQLAFLQHIYLNLEVGGRAAVILPDNALFEDGVSAQIRRELMDKCNLHTILRLPVGIFPNTNIKTNVLFFSKGLPESSAETEETWIYDMRAQSANFSKSRALAKSDFDDFIKAYGSDPLGRGHRQDQGPDGRFRAFSRAEIADRQDKLNISWLREDNGDDGPTEPAEIASMLIGHLRQALEDIEAINLELNDADDTVISGAVD